MAEGIKQLENEIEATIQSFSVSSSHFAEIVVLIHSIQINAHIHEGSDIKRLIALAHNHGDQLQEMAIQFLGTPHGVAQLAEAERQGERIAEPVINQGHLVSGDPAGFGSRILTCDLEAPKVQRRAWAEQRHGRSVPPDPERSFAAL